MSSPHALGQQNKAWWGRGHELKLSSAHFSQQAEGPVSRQSQPGPPLSLRAEETHPTQLSTQHNWGRALSLTGPLFQDTFHPFLP